MWESLHVPQRHRQALENIDRLLRCEPWAKAYRSLVKRLGSGFTVVLHGPRGNGKTQLAVAVLRESCDRRMLCRFTDAISLFIRLRDSYRDGGPRESEVIREFITPRVLVIDEAHERADSDWENRTLTHIVNRRYGDMKDTILITNETESEAAQSLGLSITSRMLEGGAFIHCNWQSFRDQR